MAGGTRGQGSTNLAAGTSSGGPHSDRELLERFVARRDEAAFAVLVARHGPMVLAVCRRVLGAGPDADDAFQATFLILVQKAATLTQPELLSNWLFGVAARTARKARTAAARRVHRERQAAKVASSALPPNSDADDLRSLLDEELEQLPPRYRIPLVLCYLEGLTNEEAARRLGWPSGSISYRLARGRELLRQRLGRRAAFAPLVFPGVLDNLGPAALPPGLLDLTVQSAMTLARQGTFTASPVVQRLVEDARRNSSPGLLAVVVAVLVLSLLAAGATTAAATGYLPWRADSSPSGTGTCH